MHKYRHMHIYVWKKPEKLYIKVLTLGRNTYGLLGPLSAVLGLSKSHTSILT